MKVWVDTKTGTWGDPADLVFVDAHDWEIAIIEQGASDSEIIEWGKAFGHKQPV